MNYSSHVKYVCLMLMSFIVSSTRAESKIPERITQKEDSLIQIYHSAETDSLKIFALYEMSRNIYVYDYLQGLKYADQSIELSEELDNLYGLSWGHFLKGMILYYISQFDRCQVEMLKSLEYNEVYRSDKLFAYIYIYLGMIFNAMEDYEKTLLYYEKAYPYCEIDYKTGISDINNNIGHILKEKGKYDQALMYLEKSIVNSDPNRFDGIATIYTNIAEVYLLKEEFELAKEKLKFISSFEDKIETYNTLGDFYYMYGMYYQCIKNYDHAIPYYEKAIHLGKEKLFWYVVSESAEKLKDIYLELGDYKKVYESMMVYNQSIDSLKYIETNQNIVKLEMKYEYDQYLSELKLKQQKKNLKYLLYSIILLAGILLIGFLYYRQRKRILNNSKQQEIQKKLYDFEMKNSVLEKEKLRDELEFKNNELMNFALQIVQKNNFLKGVRDKFKILRSKLSKNENLKILKDLDVFLQQLLNLDKARKEFHVNIEMLNKSFFYKLREKSPELSKNEEKLAVLLRLNYSSKDISALMGISSSSVDTARYRLRKKLNIDADITLYTYFNNL